MESFAGVSPHRPLNRETGEIRVVTLLPGTFNASIECEIDHVVFEQDADYEALSYHWGDATITEPILLDGRTYPVTLNLICALRYLRLEDCPRRLWIDSLCINQPDKEERAREVARMREIYEQARDVVIWIGDYSPQTRSLVRRLFEAISKIPEVEGKEEITSRTLGLDYIWQFGIHLREFLNCRPWFRRMWVIQEVAVRPFPGDTIRNPDSLFDQPRLICGHLSLPLMHLLNISHLFEAERPGALALPQICPSLPHLMFIWEEYQSLKSVGYDDASSPVPYGRYLAWYLNQVSSRFDASDPRDLVFALAGLAKTKRAPACLDPDYNKVANDLFIECAAFIIQDGRELDIFQFNSMQNKELPTWVPDWKYRRWWALQPRREPHHLFHAVVLEAEKALEVDVHCFTEIDSVGPAFYDYGTTSDTSRLWLQFLADLERLLGEEKPLTSYVADFDEAITLLAHMADLMERGSNIPIFPNNLAQLRPNSLGDWLGGLDDIRRKNPFEALQIEQDLESRAARLAGRYFFHCEDGSIGCIRQVDVVPEVGDYICSIRGGYSEHVLRHIPSKGPESHTIVGQCVRTDFGVGIDSLDTLIRRHSSMGQYKNAFDLTWENCKPERILIY